MRIEVLYFAAAREAAGTAEEALDLPEGATVARARDALLARRPGLARVLDACRLAVDEAFAAEDLVLRPGAVVAVLPPVSGG